MNKREMKSKQNGDEPNRTHNNNGITVHDTKNAIM